MTEFAGYRFTIGSKLLHLAQDTAAIGILVLFTILIAPFYLSTSVEDDVYVENGEIDLSDTNLSVPVSLKGNWRFHWEQYVDEIHGDTVSSVAVPGFWSDSPEAFHAKGYATYGLTIRGLKPGSYEFYIPMIYAASSVWMDGTRRTMNGELGTNSASTKTTWLDHSIPFTSNGEEHEFLIEVAAFHHRSSGIELVPIIGTQRAVEAAKQLFNSKDMYFQAALSILALYGFAIFVFRITDRSSLHFGLFCAALSVSSLVFGVNFWEFVKPGIEFNWLLFILYVPTTFSMIFFLNYVELLYKGESFRRIGLICKLLFIGFGISYTILLLGNNSYTASTLFPYFTILMIAYFFLIFAIVFRAAWRGKEGARIFLFGFGIMIFTISSEVIVQANILPEENAPLHGLGALGFMAFLVAQVMILAVRWSRTLSRSERMANDLGRLIDMSSAVVSDDELPNLLNRIIVSCRQFLSAERGTLFLFDAETNELWSLVAEGVTFSEIRIPSDEGLAGACFQSGEIIRVKNAYKDERFLGRVDDATGFRTKSIMSVPVETKTGTRIGVIQVLNKIGESAFGDEDEQRITAFASQAAISLENAELFGEVTWARKYNESILSSMSNGVISINKNNVIEKVNPAAVKIWGGEEKQYIGQDAVAQLRIDNSWLADELLSTSIDGQARNFVDVDVLTFNSTKQSMNISIVPLSNEESDMGLLIMLEDITEEKRLKGTMSRFMTKEVADKIIEQGDDALSGVTVNASILFVDLRDFTTLSEQLGPQETVSMLNEFFGYMTEAVFSSLGVLDKFIGDSIMAVFGAPIESDHDADNAIACSIEMMNSVLELNRVREARNDPPIRISIGIATGAVVAGTIGSTKRMEYTVVGDSVNLASRLENLTRYYSADVVFGDDTYLALENPPKARELDLIRVKGRTAPSVIYELLEHHTEQTFPNGEKLLGYYADGLDHYRNREWKKAINSFSSALRLNPNDRPSEIYKNRSSVFLHNPPPEEWDGVWTMSQKTEG